MKVAAPVEEDWAELPELVGVSNRTLSRMHQARFDKVVRLCSLSG